MPATIRPARATDKDNILKLLNSVFENQQRSSTIRDDKYWNWKFMSSPFGESLLTVAEDNHEIVGVDNLWPWEFHYKSTLLKAYQPCDSVVHPLFRGRGLFKAMRLYGLEAARGNNPSFMFNFPNNQSINANLSLGWFKLGRIPWIVKPIRPFRIIRGMLDSKQTSPSSIGGGYHMDIERLEVLGQEIPYHGNKIIPHRIKGYFSWRYQNHPSRQYGMISAHIGRKELAAIFTVNQSGSYREMFIVDLVGVPEIIDDLILEVIIEARKLDISIISLMQNNSFGTDRLWRLGFLQARIKNMVVLPLITLKDISLKRYEDWSLFACLHDSL